MVRRGWREKQVTVAADAQQNPPVAHTQQHLCLAALVLSSTCCDNRWWTILACNGSWPWEAIQPAVSLSVVLRP